MAKKFLTLTNLVDNAGAELDKFSIAIHEGYHDHLIESAEVRFTQALAKLYQSKDPSAKPIADSYSNIYTRILADKEGQL